MTVVLVQLILFCDFSDFGIALGINYSLFTLPLKLVILLSKIYYWSKGDGKKEIKREKTGNYAEVTDLSEIDEESNSEEPWMIDTRIVPISRIHKSESLLKKLFPILRLSLSEHGLKKFVPGFKV